MRCLAAFVSVSIQDCQDCHLSLGVNPLGETVEVGTPAVCHGESLGNTELPAFNSLPPSPVSRQKPFHVVRFTFHDETRNWLMAKGFGAYSLQLSAKQARAVVCWPQTVSIQDCQNCKIAKFPLVGNLVLPGNAGRLPRLAVGPARNMLQTRAGKMPAYPGSRCPGADGR
jgi:hypothetical protein